VCLSDSRDDAWCALFFALANAVEHGDNTISSEDLLHGIVMAVPGVAARFAPGRTDGITPRETEEELMFRLQSKNTSSARPFSATAKLALERAVDEANELGHTAVRSEHLCPGPPPRRTHANLANTPHGGCQPARGSADSEGKAGTPHPTLDAGLRQTQNATSKPTPNTTTLK
jgi:ATP-dependent Clp protease ATP-binding subunit ClpA